MLMDENKLVEENVEEVIEEVITEESDVLPVVEKGNEIVPESKDGEEDEAKQPEEEKTYEVKYKNAKGEDVTKSVKVEELVKDYQLKQASYEKLQEAAEKHKEAIETIELVKLDPISAHRQLNGVEKTREYLYSALTNNGQSNIIDTLIDVYGEGTVEPMVKQWVQRIMEDEWLKENKPDDWKRKQSQKAEEKKFLEEKMKHEADKRQVEEWKRAKEDEESGNKNKAEAKRVFTEIQSAIKKHNLPEKIKKSDGSESTMVSVVAKYMEIYESIENRHMDADEVVARMKDELIGLNTPLPKGEVNAIAEKIKQSTEGKLAKRSTRAKGDRSAAKPKESQNVASVYDAPWRTGKFD